MLVQHYRRERSTKLRNQKVAAVLKNGEEIVCEACGFDFKGTSGSRGEGFIDVHHRIPLRKLSAGSKTQLKDLALVCANCHRMIHHGGLISVDEVRGLIRER
ncbi:HNH endonuclease [uncultured Corynebacterium sp.]|uniref:HNH endonuclease n=1 Tax=uncultured Corynebacterium sp. TaxID=159447 RepID=UPI0025D5E44C|nr:HNH endonuclease [uncultured Corynebacterium sp.]